MKSRIHPPTLEMTVADFLERFPLLAEQFGFVLSSYSSDDVVRLSMEGNKFIVDFLSFKKS